MYILCNVLKWRMLQEDQYNQVTTSNHNVESWNSKDNLKVITGTGGLPKALKSYGNRGVIVSSIGMKRTPAIGFCNYSSIAGGVGTVSTDSLKKLQKINELCNNNKDFIIVDKLYNLLYDNILYML